MKTNTNTLDTVKTEPIQLVCRDQAGREIGRQTFKPDEGARADRIMIARNTAEVKAYRYNPDAAPRWGIETVTVEGGSES